MYLLGLGIILVLLKWFDVEPMASWPWAPWESSQSLLLWWPFAGAALWWWWADWSGYTKRKAMEKEDRRKLKRINRLRDATGVKSRSAPLRRH
ncbi:MAG: TIGR04438 family Trp-rich protein [Burkholderiaceae bacterium]|nr:TIGR04438 family Trp-rich protein [Burkholderiaceae bacterium]